jgi:alpha-galactosidase
MDDGSAELALDDRSGGIGRDGLISWTAGGVSLLLSAPPDAPVALVGLRAGETPQWSEAAVEKAPPLVELSFDAAGRSGSSPAAQHREYTGSRALRYHRHALGDDGESLEVIQRDPVTGLEVTTRFEHLAGAQALRTSTTLENLGGYTVRVQYVSTLTLTGFVEPPARAFPDALRLHYARNAWTAEFRWQDVSLEQAGIVEIAGPGGRGSSRGRFAIQSTGTWSTGDYLPVGAIDNVETGETWAWQIEHNGGWQWQALDRAGDVYVGLSGPTDTEHQWSAELRPGDRFTTVPAAIAVTTGGFAAGLAELNRYRRAMRRPNDDNRTLPVIFNDYMNCLNGDPTTEKLLPLIETASRLGSEYFVIDAGWYADGPGWWDTVGAWEPSTRRFPDGGLRAVTDRIHAAGMRPGVWVEPEVVGVDSPIADTLPADAFFQRDGQRIVESGRYQLDYRHPAVIERMDQVVDRLVADFGLGYFKFDYNINPGLGTDVGGGDRGQALLDHNRAYSRWLDGIFARHPGLVIENCSSGGMRVDYSQLSRMSIQSTTDQTDPLHFVPIAAAAPSALTPEQAANWAYPQPDWSDDVNALTMVNAMLGRIHLSGRVDLLDAGQLSLVSDAIGVYKEIRSQLPQSDPFWPLGLPGWYDAWCSLGLRTQDEDLIAVWRRGGEQTTRLPLPQLRGRAVTTEVLYPRGSKARAYLDQGEGTLDVTLPNAPSACLLRVRDA